MPESRVPPFGKRCAVPAAWLGFTGAVLAAIVDAPVALRLSHVDVERA